jgi:carbamoyl-phosphate synthase large subunit
MKAVRSLEQNIYSMKYGDYSKLSDGEVFDRLVNIDDNRLFAMAEALRRGFTIEQITRKTKIDAWFIDKISILVEMEQRLASEPMSYELMCEAKRLEFPDRAIAEFTGKTTQEITHLRKAEYKITPVFKIVDTCAAEFEAATPYYYSCYGGVNEVVEGQGSRVEGQGSRDQHPRRGDRPRSPVPAGSREQQDDKVVAANPHKILVLGSGPIRIGQGIEFDYCCVHSTWAFHNEGYETIIINNNPETVSTDFDIADKLYFEPLTAEDVEAIADLECPSGALVQFGGQTAIKLTADLLRMGVPIFGTSAKDVDAAEDRQLFDEILGACGIKRPAGKTVFTAEEAVAAARELGYPVLVRPSYVLGGAGMQIAISDDEVREFMEVINRSVQEHPILVDKYLMGMEVEVDAVCDGEDILIPGIMEHVERAGIHSGDSISVYPAQNIPAQIQSVIVEYTRKLASSLHVLGLINIQFIVYNDEVYCIEVNPRSSRTVPYISKVTGIPIVDLATKAILGAKLRDLPYGVGLAETVDYVAVKMPVFSFEKIMGADTALGPEMKSTGECLGIAKTFDEALYKAFLGAGIDLPKHKKVIITVKDADKGDAVKIGRRFAALGYEIYATRSTAVVLNESGVEAIPVRKIDGEPPTIMDLLLGHEIDLVVDTPTQGRDKSRDGFIIRRTATEIGVPCLTSLDTVNALLTSIENHKDGKLSVVDITKI